MAGITDRIKEWANDLKYWERCAFEKILNDTVITPEEYEELLQELKRDAGLDPVPADRPPLSFSFALDPVVTHRKYHLERLFNLNSVNALPNNQELRFGPQLTLIFGDNGAGKSGYARLLGSAAFARGGRDVLPNAALDCDGEPEAQIEVSADGLTQILKWDRNTINAELMGFYVFDGANLNAHLNQLNALNFVPSGLSLLKRLAEATDKVRDLLRKSLEARETVRTFGDRFIGDSNVKNVISSLGPDTDL